MRHLLSRLAIASALIGLTGAAAQAASAADAAPATADRTEQITVGGVARSYLLHIPAGLGANPPVMLVFHGSRGTGEKMAQITGMTAVADANRFIVVYPNGIGNSWNDGRPTATAAAQAGADDIGFTSALIDKLIATYHADPQRVYAVGGSNGGAFANRIGCELTDKVAAIASAGGPMTQQVAAACKPSRPLPVLLVQGTADPIVSYKSMLPTVKRWRRLDGCRQAPVTESLPDVVDDGTHVTRASSTGCKAGSSVVFYTIVDGGHAWPGGQSLRPEAFVGKLSGNLDTSWVIWDFLVNIKK